MIIPALDELRGADFQAGVLLNIFKPEGLTSFDVVKRIRSWSKCKKAGHAGTLDPLATGVLIVCTGLATKKISLFVEQRKEYIATIHLGKESNTDDREGEIIDHSPIRAIDKNEILEILADFKGKILQVPPMFSALKKNGVPLYKLARQGKTISREPRPVEIDYIDLLKWETPYLSVRAGCSKGTYIRALARDIGVKLGVGGMLSDLNRTRVGDFKVEDSFNLEAIRNKLLGNGKNDIN